MFLLKELKSHAAITDVVSENSYLLPCHVDEDIDLKPGII